jgi:hypothetical protein
VTDTHFKLELALPIKAPDFKVAASSDSFDPVRAEREALSALKRMSMVSALLGMAAECIMAK